MIICSLIQSQQLMSRTLLVDITSAGTSAFAECTLREIWWEFCKSFSILSLSLSLSAFAVKPADVRSQSFKSNVTVMVYAAITEAIKVPKWKIRSHLSSWEKYIVWRFLDSVFFFFFFPRTSAKCFCGFIYHDTSRLFSHSGVNSYFSPTADDSSHIHLLSLLCPPPRTPRN